MTRPVGLLPDSIAFATNYKRASQRDCRPRVRAPQFMGDPV